MTPFSGGLPGAMQDAGLLVGFFLSLAIGSYLLRDNLLARLGQYVLVGAGLGYLGVLALRNVLWPRIFAPILADPMSWSSLRDPELWRTWTPLALGLLMWAGGVDLLRAAPGRRSGRRLLRLAAVFPAAILAGVLLGATVSGALQGTLWPQVAAALDTWEPEPAPASAVSDLTAWLLRSLGLLITGGVLVHLQARPLSASEGPAGASRPAGSEPEAEARARPFGSLFLGMLAIWEGLGRRALWLAAGIIFAKLAAARISLAQARLEYLLLEIPRSDLWLRLWAGLQGGS